MKKSLLCLALAGLYATNATAANKNYDSASPVSVISAEDIQNMDMPSAADMWKIIQQQNLQLQNQNRELIQLRGVQEQTDAKIEATADAIDNSSIASVAEWVNDTSFGGYGELHYNNLDNQFNGGKADKDEVDLHRFVLFFGHEFTDDVRFFSEFEIEHSIAGEDQEGEVEVEQAYVEWDFAENHTAKAGVFLIPVGILNETHEPDTFYGTERNPVEKNIIPSTWWEGGAAVNGEIAEGLSYDVAFHSGLKIDLIGGDYKVRDGRQKVAKADADSGAATARIKYTGIEGLELAATVQHQSDVAQSAFTSTVDANLYEAHATYQNGPFQLRALYAMWDLDDAINTVKAGADEQEGFYIEPSYKLTEKLGIFARYNVWDNQAGDNNDTEMKQIDVGLNYWVAPTVVLKADYQDQNAPTGKDEFDGLNLGVGWSF